jgi:hypothetical protein
MNDLKNSRISLAILFVIIICVVLNVRANPVLTPGVWTNLPLNGIVDYPGDDAVPTLLTLDPGDYSTIYMGNPVHNLYRSTDAGSNWTALGVDNDPNIYDTVSPILPYCNKAAVDPHDRQHLYCTDGVRGNEQGFWISHDGGHNWHQGLGGDLSGLSVDPTDFNHVIVGTHDTRGLVFESVDGGVTWNFSKPGDAAPGGGSFGLHILYHPSSGTGNKNTWMAHGEGVWRTTDAGAHWIKVSDLTGVHGNTEAYYTKRGVLYSGGYPQPIRSTDNGLTWEALGGLPGNAYYTICGDGTNLYVCSENSQFMTSPETDGNHWTACQGAQPGRSSVSMCFDSVGQIMYSVNWDKGFWAMKVKATSTRNAIAAKPASVDKKSSNHTLMFGSGKMTARKEGRIFDVRGQRIGFLTQKGR